MWIFKYTSDFGIISEWFWRKKKKKEKENFWLDVIQYLISVGKILCTRITHPH